MVRTWNGCIVADYSEVFFSFSILQVGRNCSLNILFIGTDGKLRDFLAHLQNDTQRYKVHFICYKDISVVFVLPLIWFLVMK